VASTGVGAPIYFRWKGRGRKNEAGPLMENQMGNGPLMDADGNADGNPDGIRTADGVFVSADISVY